jgi:hypothetical protein
MTCREQIYAGPRRIINNNKANKKEIKADKQDATIKIPVHLEQYSF